MRRALLLVALAVSLAAVNVVQPSSGTRGPVIAGNTDGGVQYHDGTWIVELLPGTDTESFLADHGIARDRAYVYQSIFAGFSADLSAAEAEEIASSTLTRSVTEDEVVVALADQTTGPVSGNIPNSGALPWGLDLIDQRTAIANGHYVYSRDGTGVKVYVVDTGVNAAHADFGARVVDGWSYRATGALVTNMWSSTGSCKQSQYGWTTEAGKESYKLHPFDVDTFDQTVDALDKGKSDNEGHGTHVAGIVGGSATGVAKNVTIVPVRILNSCGTGTTTIANAGIDWIITNHSNSQKAVVNMSLGFEGRPCKFERLLSGAYDPASVEPTCRTQPASWLFGEGVTVVAAAGNSPDVDPCNTAPAATPGTISVGAVGPTLQEAYYSAYGECVDIFAPGGSGYVGQGINSTWHYLYSDSGNTSTYSNEAGTSMAAPHVAGAVAQYLGGLASLPSDISTLPGQVWTWLKNQATCDEVTYYSSSRTSQSPNRFLNIGSAASAPCAPKNVAGTQAAGSSVISWSAVPSGNGNEITGYRVTTSPATTGCSTLLTDQDPLKCTLTGLSDGTVYTVSVKATTTTATEGTAGTLSLVAGVDGVPITTTVPPTTTTLLPSVTPTAATPVTAVSTAKWIVLSWPAVVSSDSVKYQVAVSPGGVTCSTTSTRCTFTGTQVGTSYTFSIVAVGSSGQVSGALKYTVTAGINQKVTSVKVKSRTLLSKLVSSLSKGARTYRVTSGKCKVSAGRLVAPSTTGTCKVKVSIARYRTYRAMSAVLTVSVV